jgi:hypothetical protein
VGQTVVQNLTLPLAGVVGKVEVKEQSDAVEAAATTSSVAFGYDRIEEAPALLAGKNVHERGTS